VEICVNPWLQKHLFQGFGLKGFAVQIYNLKSEIYNIFLRAVPANLGGMASVQLMNYSVI
jgi:hypothetical protein